MKDKKIIFIIAGVIILLIIVVVLIVMTSGSNHGNQNNQKTSDKVKIVWWGPYENKEAYEILIEAYEEKNPNVKIEYNKKNYKNLEEYQNEIVNAIADGEGPDIWSIKNDWLPKHYKKLAPLPSKILSNEEYKNKFFPIISEEMTINNQIYGIPFNIDSLILIINKDHFSQADIEEEVITWNKFIKIVETLTEREGNTIQKAGTALGTANNVKNAFDILSLLMLQNNTKMVSNDKKEAEFNLPDEEKKEGNKPYYPGTAALKFYTDFSSTKKKAYTWNNSMGNSQEEFINGRVSMIIGYLEDTWIIKKRNSKLKIKILPIPEPKEGDEINYTSFWAQVVSKTSSHQEIAWDFLNFCLNEDIINQYYNFKKEKNEPVTPSILKIAENQPGNQDIEIIVKQAKTSKNWYKGDALKIENIFLKMIDNALSGQPIQTVIDVAAKSSTNVLNQIQK